MVIDVSIHVLSFRALNLYLHTPESKCSRSWHYKSSHSHIMSVLLPMGAGQSQRRRVTDLMFSTQVAIFCLVQYTIMVSIGDCTDDYPSCHTA